MPRQLRIEMAGGFYHVMARGNRREAIFVDQSDRAQFLDLLGQVCRRHGWRVHAWVLMGNHYHLLLETPQPNLVSGMRQLQQTYTMRFNRRHKVSGHLFGGRYKAVLIQGDLAPADAASLRQASRAQPMADYFTVVADYIHLNPVRARLVRLGKGKGLLAYAWSSLAHGYARPAAQRGEWMEVERVLTGYEQKDTAAGRRRMIEDLEEKAQGEAAERAGVDLPEGQSLHASLRRGWYFGTQGFGERMLKALQKTGVKLRGRKGEHYEGARAVREHGENEAERLATAGLRRLGVDRRKLAAAGRTRGDARPVAVAMVVREQTTVSLAWVAEHCGLRNAPNAAQCIHQLRRRLATTPALHRLVAQVRAFS